MNYIDIKEAVKATGKSEKTIRRFLSKAESKPYLDKKDNKLLVDVNYLFTSYPPVKSDQKEGGQKLDTGQKMSIDMEMLELKNKLTLYEQEIRYKDELLNEKDGRITDLQKAMLLLEAPKEQDQPVIKKKRWWKF
jgi:Fic family protein